MSAWALGRGDRLLVMHAPGVSLGLAVGRRVLTGLAGDRRAGDRKATGCSRRRSYPRCLVGGAGPAGALANCVVNRGPSRLTAVVLIESFDPAADQQRLRACYEIVEACGRHDDPGLPGWSFGAFSAGWAHGWGTPHQAWLAHGDAGEPVGCYLLLLPDKANLTRLSDPGQHRGLVCAARRSSRVRPAGDRGAGELQDTPNRPRPSAPAIWISPGHRTPDRH
jgi:hypothetical protein